MSIGDYLSIPKLNNLERGICIELGTTCERCEYYYHCNYEYKDDNRSSFERMRDGNRLKQNDNEDE